MESPAWFFTKALSHRQKVLRLYKRALLQCEYWYMPEFIETRYHKMMIRARFDAFKDIQDMRKAQRIYTDGIRELWQKQHPIPFQYPEDPYGVAFERFPENQDKLLETWTPQEMAQYPKYFAERRAMKKDLVAAFQKIMDEKEQILRDELDLDFAALKAKTEEVTKVHENPTEQVR